MIKMSSSTPIGDEILRKKLSCSKQNYKLETVFINPMDLISLINDDRFQEAQYSSPEKGKVGEFLGVKIIVSTNVPVHKLLFAVSIGGYRSIQDQAWDKEKQDREVNPSRRDD